MTEKIIHLPDKTMMWSLKAVNIMLAVVISLFCHISGQNSKNKSTGKPGFFSNLFGSSARAAVDVQPEYGVIAPLYGIQPPVAKYGMPFAEFKFTGKIKSALDEAPIQKAKITLQDPTKKTTVDSTFSNAEGEYELRHAGYLNLKWILKVEDSDNVNNGNYKEKDTLIDFPVDSLKDSSGFNLGKGSMRVDFLLDQHPTRVKNPQEVGIALEVIRTSPFRENTAVILRYKLPYSESVQLTAFNAAGNLIANLDRSNRPKGEHTVLWNPGRLVRGIYYFRLVAGDYVLIQKGNL